MYLYPPPDLTLAGAEQAQEWADPATDWISRGLEVLGENLSACREWRRIDVPEARQAVLCDDRELQNVLHSVRRVALTSDLMLVLVHAIAEKRPGTGCDPLATTCPPTDEPGAAYVEALAIDVARRMLASAEALN